MRARHDRRFENHYTLNAPRRAAKAPCTLHKKKAPHPHTTLRKRIGGGELKTEAYAIQPTEDQSMVLNRNAP